MGWVVHVLAGCSWAQSAAGWAEAHGLAQDADSLSEKCLWSSHLCMQAGSQVRLQGRMHAVCCAAVVQPGGRLAGVCAAAYFEYESTNSLSRESMMRSTLLSRLGSLLEDSCCCCCCC